MHCRPGKVVPCTVPPSPLLCSFIPALTFMEPLECFGLGTSSQLQYVHGWGGGERKVGGPGISVENGEGQRRSMVKVPQWWDCGKVSSQGPAPLAIHHNYHCRSSTGIENMEAAIDPHSILDVLVRVGREKDAIYCYHVSQQMLLQT